MKTQNVFCSDAVLLEKAVVTDEGFLRDSPVVTRAGVFLYRNPDGTQRREFRPPEEVLRADSLATYKGKPIVVTHVGGLVNAKNAKHRAIGTMLSEGIAEHDHVRVDLVIYDEQAIKEGPRELSLGYTLDLELTPGEYNGEHYDCIQKNIRVNHLALVNKARAGSIARLNLDGDEIIEEERMDSKMVKIRLDNGLEYDAAPEVAVAFNEMKEKFSQASQRADGIQKQLDTVTAERDSLKAKVDTHAAELDNVRKDAAEKLNEAVKARVELLKAAEAHRIDGAEQMTDKEIKTAVIKAVRGDAFGLEGKSDAYIDAAFDLAKGETRMDGIRQQRKEVNEAGADNKETRADSSASSAEARQKMIERMQKAHMEGGK